MNANQSPVTIEDVMAGRTLFDANTRVSNNSRFGDDFWDFTNPQIARFSSVPNGRLRLDWAMYCTVSDDNTFSDHRGALITKEMVQELKVFAFLYLTLPSAFGMRGVQSAKPQTVVITVRALIVLFSDVLRHHRLLGLEQQPQLSSIRYLTDVSLQDIRTVLKNFPRANGDTLKKGLSLLAHPQIARAISVKSLQWNARDIKGLAFKFPEKRTDYEKVMPNELFRFLSNSACADVLSFLSFLGESAHDQSGQPSTPPIGLNCNGAQMLSDYIAIREFDRSYSARLGKRGSSTAWQRKKFRLAYGVTPKEMFLWLYRVQRAAFTVIGLYTGARYSDLTSFTTNCIHTFHGQFVLTGTLVKNESLDAQEGKDLWPAIPIMRDAMVCLTHISRITHNPYILSGCETVPIGKPPYPLSLNGFSGAISNYLHEVDTAGRWVDWHINAHLLRHTLAHQLARADVGLVFIAHQMKHLHTALNALPPDVTMMYGNVGELATQRALHSGSAYLEAAKELYSPDRPVAGGGADAFIARRKAYFEGMAAQGWTVDEVLTNLAMQGLPFASVGIGYCGGVRDTLLKDGTKERPPCIGSLQCNPIQCQQAVITKTHEPAWQKVVSQNRNLAADPRMAHAKEPLLEAMKAAEEVLARLNPESGVLQQ
ncbi:tyrosine-type recombinase/integrase [Orrella marina]|nr:tyrosine-type recombinase/integrase [Orrella marina]